MFRVFIAGVTGWKLVCAKDADRAVKRFKNATHARIVRTSSYMQAQRAAGLYPGPNRRRRK